MGYNYNFFANNGDITQDAVLKYTKKKCKLDKIPIVWALLSSFYNFELYYDRGLAKTFKAFVEEFYPDFSWFIEDNDFFNVVFKECVMAKNYFLKIFAWRAYNGVTLDDGSVMEPTLREKKLMDRALYFGSIVRDFLVRYCGYVVVNHDDMTIDTSGLECDTRINEFVAAGYSVNKMDRLVYERVGENPFSKKQFVGTTEIEPPIPRTVINL